MSTPPPEQRIREHLEKRGRPSQVELRRLLGTWRITDPTDADRRRVTEALESAGLVVDPDIADTPLDAQVVVSIADASTLARRARMREAAAVAERERAEADERDRAAAEERERAAAEERERAAAEERERAAAEERERARAERDAEVAAAAEAARARAEAEEDRARLERDEQEERAAREAERRREEEAERDRAREADEARAAVVADAEARDRAERARREERVAAAAAKDAERAQARRTRDRVWMQDAADERPDAGTPVRGARLGDDDPGPGPDAVDADEPVEVPENVPRSLLTAGAAILAIALLLPWFQARRGGIVVDGLDNAWEFLGILDLLVVVTVLGASALVLLRPPGPVPARIVGGLATIVLVGVAYRIGAPPDDVVEGLILDVDVRPGPFVALLGCALVICGAGLLARVDEIPAVARRSGGRDGGTGAPRDRSRRVSTD